MTAAISERADLCLPCCELDTSCCPDWDDYDEDTRTRAEMLAWQSMDLLTGRQLAACPVTIRPCRTRCKQGAYYIAPVSGGGGGGFFPHILDGQWVNLTCGCGQDGCSCSEVCEVILPGPVAEVTEVCLDGCTLDPCTYRIDDHVRLVREDGECFPLCFPAGTLVTARRGQIPIEDVCEGDEVLTHRGRWRSVLASRQTGIRETVTMSARGELTATADHPIWAREMTRIGNQRKFGEPEWVPAAATVGQYVARASVVNEESDLPTPDGWGHQEDFWRFVGFWLGDGWTTSHERTRNFGIRLAVKKLRKRAFIEALPWEWRTHDEVGGNRRYSVSDESLWRWLRENFGVGARGKTIPSWLLGAPIYVIEQFVDGLVRADGYRSGGETRVTTVSKPVAVALGILLNRLGTPSSVYPHTDGQYQIVWREGEPVKPQLTVDDRAVWARTRGVEHNSLAVPVYDIEVAEDHSFVADGFVVHNCQDMNAPSCSENTFAVTYKPGRAPDELMAYAAGVMACEFAKACNGGKCRLPAGVTEISRQGITMTIGTGAFPGGYTGIREVDAVIAAWNPHGLTAPPVVWSPDVSHGRTTTW